MAGAATRSDDFGEDIPVSWFIRHWKALVAIVSAALLGLSWLGWLPVGPGMRFNQIDILNDAQNMRLQALEQSSTEIKGQLQFLMELQCLPLTADSSRTLTARYLANRCSVMTGWPK